MDLLNRLKENWNQLSVFASALGTLFSTFLVGPPTGGAETAWYRFGTFLVALLTGLWLVPLSKWSAGRFVWRWWTAAGVCVVLSTAAFLWYSDRIDNWTVPYWRDRRVVIGEHLTPDALNYQKSSGETDPLRLLKSYAGDAAAVWDEKEIATRQRILLASYLAVLLLLASAVVTVSQAAYCATASSRKSKRSSAQTGSVAT